MSAEGISRLRPGEQLGDSVARMSPASLAGAGIQWAGTDIRWAGRTRRGTLPGSPAGDVPSRMEMSGGRKKNESRGA